MTRVPLDPRSPALHAFLTDASERSEESSPRQVRPVFRDDIERYVEPISYVAKALRNASEEGR